MVVKLAVRIRTPPSLIHLLCSLLCHHCCLLALLRALWEGCSSMHDENFVRRGEKVQYTWRLVFFALWWCSVYACDCHCSWCVVCQHRHRAAASVLGHVLIFTVLAWFCLHYSLELCHAMPCWHGCWNCAMLACHGTVGARFGCIYTSI